MTCVRWSSSPADWIRDPPLRDARAEHLPRVMESGIVSTNVCLRRTRNFAVDPGWLPWPLILPQTPLGCQMGLSQRGIHPPRDGIGWSGSDPGASANNHWCISAGQSETSNASPVPHTWALPEAEGRSALAGRLQRRQLAHFGL